METVFDFFVSSSNINVLDVLVNIGCSVVMSQLVYLVYIRFGNTFSNRNQFGKIFMLVTVCTTLVITLIQASLALSLGLVGALSIVRFRAAVKEPEELAYTFLCVAVGLGFGAGERGITLVVSVLILIILIMRGLYKKRPFKKDTYNFNVITASMEINDIISILDQHTKSVMLRRCDNDGSKLNAQFNIEFTTVAQLNQAVGDLKGKDPAVMTSFVSSSSLM